MTTEAKIREAFDKWLQSNGTPDELMYQFIGELDPFTAGYMALLNELEPEMAITDSNFSSHLVETLYRLPEGVEKP